MMREVVDSPQIRARWVACDAAFGRASGFLDDVASSGLWYCAEVPHDTRVWLERPVTTVPRGAGRGRKPTRERLYAGQHEAQTVTAMAEQVLSTQWQRPVLTEGSQGPMAADFWGMRVVAGRDGWPGPDIWLVRRRQRATGELKTYLCNAPPAISLPTLARISGMRWPSETCFEPSQPYLGMSAYEVRRGRGWHHHRTLCILAHFFLVRQQVRLKKTCGV